MSFSSRYIYRNICDNIGATTVAMQNLYSVEVAHGAKWRKQQFAERERQHNEWCRRLKMHNEFICTPDFPNWEALFIEDMIKMKEKLFTGIQPTGDLHLGNYLGAIRPSVDYQNDYECLFCIADQHAITTFQKPEALRESTLSVAAALVASGIRADEHILFKQSNNSDHASLASILNCITPMGRLSRMTQFKDKSGENEERVSCGLFVYPILMAADILAYRATRVPVGNDQKQHLELVQYIAGKFNRDFACENFFPKPFPLIPDLSARVMSLRDSTQKMSKSDSSAMSRITFSDDADSIAHKVKKAQTTIVNLPDNVTALAEINSPIFRNFVNIYASLLRQTTERALQDIGGMGFADFKPLLCDVLISEFLPITIEANNLLKNDRTYLQKMLDKGGDEASSLSAPILRKVYDIVGFGQ